MAQTYTIHQVLEAIDASAAKWQFIILDGGKEKPADVRMTAYRDDYRWAIVLEELMFFPASPGHSGIVDSVYRVGNSISAQAPRREKAIQVTADTPQAPTFLPPFALEVNPNVRMIRIRDAVVPVDLSPPALARKGIPQPIDGKLRGQHLLWSLLPENRELLLATDEERHRHLPGDLPTFIQLDEWHHPAIITEGLKPSDSETFQMLAEAIATGDPSRYRPSRPPNTNWQNWLGYERV